MIDAAHMSLRIAFISLLIISSATTKTAKHIFKRQVSLDDIIQGALNFVRPIIDTSKPLSTEFLTSNKAQTEQTTQREAEILGIPKYSSLNDVPICKGNSKICKFISCAAHNFKSDESLANLNLAAQVIADRKLRKAITSDPNTLITVCHEQGLSSAQCKLFSNAFQLIDRLISTIEPVGLAAKKLHQYIIKDDPYYDDLDAPPIPIRPGSYSQNYSLYTGSQTWSTHGNNESNLEFDDEPIKPPTVPNSPTLLNFFTTPVTSTTTKNSEEKEETVERSNNSQSTRAPHTPNPFTFPPLLFTFPTFPTLPPSPVQAFDFMKNLLTPQILSAPNFLPPFLLVPNITNETHEKNIVIIRKKRTTDYYEDIDEENESGKGSKESMIYDDQPTANHVDDKDRKGIIDCIKYLE